MPQPLWARLLRNRRTGARRWRARIEAIDELPPEERNRPEMIALRAQLVESRAALKRRYDERLAELDHIVAGDLARLEGSDDDVVLVYRTSAKLIPPDPPVPGSSQDGAVVTARPVPRLLGVTAPLPPPLDSRLLPSSWLSLTGGNIRPSGNIETDPRPALEPFAATTPLRPPRNLESVATSEVSSSGNTSGTAQNIEAVSNPLLPPDDLESLPTPWLTFSVKTIEPTQNTEAVPGQVISRKRPRPESPESINPLDTVDEDIPTATSVAEPLGSTNSPDSVRENVTTATSATEPPQFTNSSTPLRQQLWLKIAGILYTPENAKDKLPAVVIAHPITSVKEQSPVHYAKPLAQAGYLVLIYDATYQGESEGQPRQLENPSARVEDIKDAVSYLLTLDNVDPERIGVLGICGSGGYAPNAVADDLRVKAVATSAAVNFGDMVRNGYDHKLPREQFEGSLKLSNDARTAVAKGEKVDLVPMIPMSKEDADKLPEYSLPREAYYFYRTPRANNPRAPNRIYPTSFDIASGYDAWSNIDRISPRPLLMVSGTKADTLLQSQEAIKLAKEPKELCVLDGFSHVGLYDGEGAKQASAKIIEFFNKHL